MPANPFSHGPVPGDSSHGPDAAHHPGEELDFDAGTVIEPSAARLERRPLNRPVQSVPVEPSPDPPAVFEADADERGPGYQDAGAKGGTGKGAPLEKKSAVGTQTFTRFMARPETAVVAGLTNGQTSAGGIISRSQATSKPAFGKIRHQQELDCRPNRLQQVMEELWTHSRLEWLDQLGRIKAIILGSLVAVTAFIILWPYFKEVSRKLVIGSPNAASPEVSFAPDAARQAGIRRAFDAYLAAPGIAEKLRWVIGPQRVEFRMRDYYVTRQQTDPVITSYTVSPPVRAGAEWWFTISFVPAGGTPTTVSMKETPEGGLLDWENFVAYGTMSWEKFVAGRPKAPQSMRVRLRLSSDYGGKYQAGEYLAFEVSHGSGPPVLHGYALKDSRSGQQLAALPELQDWKSFNLYLAWEQDAGRPEAVLISDLIRSNWLDGAPGPPAQPSPQTAASRPENNPPRSP